MKIASFPGFAALHVCWLAVAAASPLQEAVRAHRVTHEQALMAEYRELVRIPNVGADQPNIRRNAEFIAAMMQRRGIPAELLEGRTSATNPAVFAEIKVPGATRTVVFYAHYDGMPVSPKEWAEGLDPWDPVFLTAPIARGGKIITDWTPATRSTPTGGSTAGRAPTTRRGCFPSSTATMPW